MCLQSQVMPQLLHYLKVDDQTRLSTPLPGTATGAAVEEGEAVPAAIPEGGRAFFNQKDTVSATNTIFVREHFGQSVVPNTTATWRICRRVVSYDDRI
jgi:hypothetical protein